jgi:lysophospholipase L1-like esterase
LIALSTKYCFAKFGLSDSIVSISTSEIHLLCVAKSLCRGPQKRTMRESEVQIRNSAHTAAPEEAEMRIRLVNLSVLVMLWGSALARAAEPPTYYLALGDSLAQGVQPSATGDVATNQGYADDLHALLRLREPGLVLAKLGCSGETTTTMILGGVCNYGEEGSQLAAAVSFLKTHHVSLVTLDIGANNIDQCISLTNGIDTNCVANGLQSVGIDLPQILTELRYAAGPDTLIVAMNYYDPFLAAWTLGPSGQALAVESLEAATDFNAILENVYQRFAIPVADVARAYRISNFVPVPEINLPVNVLLTLTWTWMDALAPVGPDIHPNPAGYAVIAGAFAKEMARR